MDTTGTDVQDSGITQGVQDSEKAKKAADNKVAQKSEGGSLVGGVLNYLGFTKGDTSTDQTQKQGQDPAVVQQTSAEAQKKIDEQDQIAKEAAEKARIAKEKEDAVKKAEQALQQRNNSTDPSSSTQDQSKVPAVDTTKKDDTTTTTVDNANSRGDTKMKDGQPSPGSTQVGQTSPTKEDKVDISQSWVSKAKPTGPNQKALFEKAKTPEQKEKLHAYGEHILKLTKDHPEYVTKSGALSSAGKKAAKIDGFEDFHGLSETVFNYVKKNVK
jgi:hypothetical protein